MGTPQVKPRRAIFISSGAKLIYGFTESHRALVYDPTNSLVVVNVILSLSTTAGWQRPARWRRPAVRRRRIWWVGSTRWWQVPLRIFSVTTGTRPVCMVKVGIRSSAAVGVADQVAFTNTLTGPYY